MGLYLGKVRIGVELPPVVSTSARKGYELRTYAPAVAAQVSAPGTALRGSEGFRALAQYIGAFGSPHNEKRGGSGGEEAIAMTAPVVTQVRRSAS